MLCSALAEGSRLAALWAAALALALAPAASPASAKAEGGSGRCFFPYGADTFRTAATIEPPAGTSFVSIPLMSPVPPGPLDPDGIDYTTLLCTGSSPARFCGFLGLDFIHDVVAARAGYQDLIDMVSPDTLGAYIQHLENYGTRHTNSQGVLNAGRWLTKRFLEYGYADTTLQQIGIGGKDVLAPRNVIATKSGVTKPDFRIVIGAHYDCITYGETVPAAISAPGADDDASGVAGTMEIARILRDMDLDATVQFVLFAGHEQGLYGSLEFVSNLVAEGVARDKLFFINLDMIGNSDSPPWEIKVYSDPASLPLAQLLGGMFETYTEVQPTMAGNRLADQTSFWSKGYPAVFVHEMDFNPHYHSRQDLFMYLEMDYEAEVVRGVLAMVLHLALMTDPPGGVRASETAEGGLLIEWNHSTDADVLRYHVELLDGQSRLLSKHQTAQDFLTLGRQEIEGASWVRVRCEDVLGETAASDPVLVGAGRLSVRGATPNPARSVCSFDVFIPGTTDPVETCLRIFDASGRLVRSIGLSRGSQSVHWDTRDEDGAAVPSGIYFYAVEVPGVGRDMGKIMIVR